MKTLKIKKNTSYLIRTLYFLLFFPFWSCSEAELPSAEQNPTIIGALSELSDSAYPDNPDNAIRHPRYHKINYSYIEFKPREDSLFDVMISGIHSDTVRILGIALDEFIPVACEAVRDDEYLQYIALINQEWNRHQVAFGPENFQITGPNTAAINRVDIARNCLNAGLWEVIMFADSGGNSLPIHHSWFDFPKDKYADLFERRNQLPYHKYKKPLEDWIQPENKRVSLEKLRRVLSSQTVNFYNHNAENYPLKGERLKKYKNILYPKNTTRIADFLTDSTRFATFSPPGIYNTADPRKTELSRLSNPVEINFKKIIPKSGRELLEIELKFQPSSKEKTTRLIISGIDPKELPHLDTADANKGWQNSMGFGNHSFYESYAQQQSGPSKHSPYFCILTTDDYLWLDSHEVGIDGPLLHIDAQDPRRLHIWILAFERHAFVGHYSVVME
jgi:hypothetical protein